LDSRFRIASVRRFAAIGLISSFSLTMATARRPVAVGHRDQGLSPGDAPLRCLAAVAAPKSGRIAFKVINHLGDEVMKVLRVESQFSLDSTFYVAVRHRAARVATASRRRPLARSTDYSVRRTIVVIPLNDRGI
jgi:hypothetical protein